MSRGAPQGCVLFPLPFILYTDPLKKNKTLVKFSGDTVLLSPFSFLLVLWKIKNVPMALWRSACVRLNDLWSLWKMQVVHKYWTTYWIMWLTMNLKSCPRVSHAMCQHKKQILTQIPSATRLLKAQTAEGIMEILHFSCSYREDHRAGVIMVLTVMSLVGVVEVFDCRSQLYYWHIYWLISP